MFFGVFASLCLGADTEVYGNLKCCIPIHKNTWLESIIKLPDNDEKLSNCKGLAHPPHQTEGIGMIPAYMTLVDYYK